MRMCYGYEINTKSQPHQLLVVANQKERLKPDEFQISRMGSAIMLGVIILSLDKHQLSEYDYRRQCLHGYGKKLAMLDASRQGIIAMNMRPRMRVLKIYRCLNYSLRI